MTAKTKADWKFIVNRVLVHCREQIEWFSRCEAGTDFETLKESYMARIHEHKTILAYMHGLGAPVEESEFNDVGKKGEMRGDEGKRQP